MKIAIFNPRDEFTSPQRERLARLGQTVFTHDRKALPVGDLVKMARGAEVLMVDPDNVGGFEKGGERLIQILEKTPEVKTLALSTTSYGWVDLKYCRDRGISVCNIPGYSREAVAEHVLALLLCLAKRVIVTDRKTQKGKYQLEMGFELAGKTLGVIGLGSIGSRVAELGQGIGMMVIAYNRSPKAQKGVEMVSLKELFRRSDAISINVKACAETVDMIGKNELALVKRGVIVVNTADRSIVDEKAMAIALKSGRVGSYGFEGGDLDHGPLSSLENAVGLKGFGWYTKEALERLKEIWIGNVEAALAGKPRNVVN
jgi:lactate dehydrogenase-like 2-hydroxyacid dehydrogenase